MYIPKTKLKKIMSKYPQNISEYFDSDDVQNVFDFIADVLKAEADEMISTHPEEEDWIDHLLYAKLVMNNLFYDIIDKLEED